VQRAARLCAPRVAVSLTLLPCVPRMFALHLLQLWAAHLCAPQYLRCAALAPANIPGKRLECRQRSMCTPCASCAGRATMSTARLQAAPSSEHAFTHPKSVTEACLSQTIKAGSRGCVQSLLYVVKPHTRQLPYMASPLGSRVGKPFASTPCPPFASTTCTHFASVSSPPVECTLLPLPVLHLPAMPSFTFLPPSGVPRPPLYFASHEVKLGLAGIWAPCCSRCDDTSWV